MNKASEKTEKTESFRIRLTEKENEAFKKFAEDRGETRASIGRKMVREAINGEVHLLSDEQSLVKLAIRQLAGMANNLNQLIASIHAEKNQKMVDKIYLHELKRYIETVKDEFKTYLFKTKSRWVKDDAI